MIKLFFGKSGAGKDTMLKKYLEQNKQVLPIVSYTTRPMRVGERNGVDYVFVSKENFLKLIAQNQLTEYRSYQTLVKGISDTWYYGTPILDTKDDYAGVVDIDGALKFLEKYGSRNIDLVFVYASDKTRKQRAINRGSFDETEWNRRLIADAKDFSSSRIQNLADVYGEPIRIEDNDKNN